MSSCLRFDAESSGLAFVYSIASSFIVERYVCAGVSYMASQCAATDEMTTSNHMATALLTEHFRYTPLVS